MKALTDLWPPVVRPSDVLPLGAAQWLLVAIIFAIVFASTWADIGHGRSRFPLLSAVTLTAVVLCGWEIFHG